MTAAELLSQKSYVSSYASSVSEVAQLNAEINRLTALVPALQQQIVETDKLIQNRTDILNRSPGWRFPLNTNYTAPEVLDMENRLRARITSLGETKKSLIQKLNDSNRSLESSKTKLAETEDRIAFEAFTPEELKKQYSDTIFNLTIWGKNRREALDQLSDKAATPESIATAKASISDLDAKMSQALAYRKRVLERLKTFSIIAVDSVQPELLMVRRDDLARQIEALKAQKALLEKTPEDAAKNIKETSKVVEAIQAAAAEFDDIEAALKRISEKAAEKAAQKAEAPQKIVSSFSKLAHPLLRYAP